MLNQYRVRYGIRCGSRTGSTLLCELLASTNRAGKPREFLNASLVDGIAKEIGTNADWASTQYRRQVLKSTSTENGVFGIKVVGFEQWERLTKWKIEPTHWVWLHREDTVLQAISRYKAWASGIWTKKRTANPEWNVEVSVPYDPDKISWCHDEVLRENVAMEKFFAVRKAKTIKIAYETDLMENPLQTRCAILHHLGISIENLPEVKTNSLISRNQETLEWKQRFLSETA